MLRIAPHALTVWPTMTQRRRQHIRVTGQVMAEPTSNSTHGEIVGNYADNADKNVRSLSLNAARPKRSITASCKARLSNHHLGPSCFGSAMMPFATASTSVGSTKRPSRPSSGLPLVSLFRLAAGCTSGQYFWSGRYRKTCFVDHVRQHHHTREIDAAEAQHAVDTSTSLSLPLGPLRAVRPVLQAKDRHARQCRAQRGCIAYTEGALRPMGCRAEIQMSADQMIRPIART